MQRSVIFLICSLIHGLLNTSNTAQLTIKSASPGLAGDRRERGGEGRRLWDDLTWPSPAYSGRDCSNVKSIEIIQRIIVPLKHVQPLLVTVREREGG